MKYINKSISKYKDILKLPHHVSDRHAHMSLYSRAAQFAPFAALCGYEQKIALSSRYTCDKELIDEQAILLIDSILRYIKENISAKPELYIEYFIPDTEKSGGRYSVIKGFAEKIDEALHTLVLTTGLIIPISDIKRLEIL